MPLKSPYKEAATSTQIVPWDGNRRRSGWEQLQKTIREIPNFDLLKNHIDMTVTNEGLRIELTE